MYDYLWAGAYDTVFRAREYSWPDGYHMEETESLGWFKSKTHTGVLPDMLVWVPYSRPMDFTRTSAETKLLKDASGTRTQEITSGDNTYVLESVARAIRDATFVLENGRAAAVSTAGRELPGLKNAAWMDHAVIDLKVPDPERFRILNGSTFIRPSFLIHEPSFLCKVFKAEPGFAFSTTSGFICIPCGILCPNPLIWCCRSITTATVSDLSSRLAKVRRFNTTERR